MVPQGTADARAPLHACSIGTESAKKHGNGTHADDKLSKMKMGAILYCIGMVQPLPSQLVPLGLPVSPQGCSQAWKLAGEAETKFEKRNKKKKRKRLTLAGVDAACSRASWNGRSEKQLRPRVHLVRYRFRPRIRTSLRNLELNLGIYCIMIKLTFCQLFIFSVSLRGCAH